MDELFTHLHKKPPNSQVPQGIPEFPKPALERGSNSNYVTLSPRTCNSLHHQRDKPPAP